MAHDVSSKRCYHGRSEHSVNAALVNHLDVCSTFFNGSLFEMVTYTYA